MKVRDDTLYVCTAHDGTIDPFTIIAVITGIEKDSVSFMRFQEFGTFRLPDQTWRKETFLSFYHPVDPEKIRKAAENV